MAVSRREKATDPKFAEAIGVRPPTTDREFEIDDVIEDLRDDVNNIADLANLVDGFTFTYHAASNRNRARLVITHNSSRTNFVIEA